MLQRKCQAICHLPVHRGRAVLPFRNEVSQFFGSCTIANRSVHFKKAELPMGQHVQIEFGTPMQLQCSAFVSMVTTVVEAHCQADPVRHK